MLIAQSYLRQSKVATNTLPPLLAEARFMPSEL
jgi:hypothetical protein